MSPKDETTGNLTKTLNAHLPDHLPAQISINGNLNDRLNTTSTGRLKQPEPRAVGFPSAARVFGSKRLTGNAGRAGSRPAGAEPLAGVRFTRIIDP